MIFDLSCYFFQAFFTGKLKVAGKMSYATKLQQIIPKNMTVKSKL